MQVQWRAHYTSLSRTFQLFFFLFPQIKLLKSFLLQSWAYYLGMGMAKGSVPDAGVVSFGTCKD